MRVALLSLLERGQNAPGALQPASDGLAPPRGYLSIAGRPVIRHQLALALSLGCSRIIVMSEVLSGELTALHDLAAECGVQFHVIAAGRALVSLVAPEDDLVVLGDGLLAMPQDASELIEQGQGVLVLPIETGLAAGFERIDINHAAAGIMRLPGRIVAGLADLPGDWSAPSALLRLAMQAGIRQVAVPASLLESARWTLVRSEAEAQALEPRWLRLHTALSHRRSPGEGLAAVLVHWLGPAVLHAGTRPGMISVAAVVLALLALASGWLGVAALGFILLAASWTVWHAAQLLERVDHDSLMRTKPWRHAGAVYGWAVDGLFIALSVWRSTLPAQQPFGLAVFAPLVLFALLRLLPQTVPGARSGAVWPGWLADRFLVGTGLALASLSGGFDLLVMAAVLSLLAVALIFSGSTRPAVPNPALTKPG